MRKILIAALLAACTVQPSTTVHRVKRPPDGDATCAEACARAFELRCDVSGPYCTGDCNDINAVQGDFQHVKRINTGCWVNAQSCAELAEC